MGPTRLRLGAFLLIATGLALGGCKGDKQPEGEAGAKAGEEAPKLGPDGKPLPKVEAVPVEVARAARKPIPDLRTAATRLSKATPKLIICRPMSGANVRNICTDRMSLLARLMSWPLWTRS